MFTRVGKAYWTGNLKQGKGEMEVGSVGFQVKYTAMTRFGEEKGTNPEEFIGAAHAGCFSMAFSNLLAEAGHEPKRIDTKAEVSLDKVEGGFAISRITLNTEGDVPGISEDDFLAIAEQAKSGCPVSKALSAISIELNAKLRK
jgi:osmotically inducible protein OsmC